MAVEENHKAGFNNVTAVTVTFSTLIFSYEVYSNDDALYVEEDGTATINSYRVPKDTIHESVIPCRTLSILGVSGSGLAEVKVIPYQGISDAEVIETRIPVR